MYNEYLIVKNVILITTRCSLTQYLIFKTAKYLHNNTLFIKIVLR